jgi:hypothetical protein
MQLHKCTAFRHRPAKRFQVAAPEISNNSSRSHRMAAGTSIAKLRPVNDDCRRRAAEANAGRSSGMALGALLYLWALVQPS